MPKPLSIGTMFTSCGLLLSDGDGLASVMVLLLMVGAIALYFLPCIVASSRKIDSVTGVALLNLFLGWTVLGWLAALIWACTAEKALQVQMRDLAMRQLALYQRPYGV